LLHVLDASDSRGLRDLGQLHFFERRDGDPSTSSG
jgi:hypothetical protein